jgi:hypothetical protein
MGVSGQRHAPAALLPPGKGTRTHWTGGWVGPRAGLDTEVRGKILCPCRRSNPVRPVVQPVVRRFTAWANPAPAAHHNTEDKVKKVKQSHNTAMVVQRGREGIAPTHSWSLHEMGMSGQRHVRAALYPREKDSSTHWIGGWVSWY